MTAVNVTITDTTGTATIDHSKVGDTMRSWYPHAPADVHLAINELQKSLNRAPASAPVAEDSEPATGRLCSYLGVVIE